MLQTFSNKNWFWCTVISILFICNINSAVQSNELKKRYVKKSENIDFYLENNTPFIKKRTIIIYRVDRPGNSTTVKWFFPFEKKLFSLPAGTKLFLATKEQVEKVMSGNGILKDPPTLLVSKENKGQSISI